MSTSNQSAQAAVQTATETRTLTETEPEHEILVFQRGKLGIFGAGGHAKVIADIARAGDEYDVVGFFDDNEALHGTPFYGSTVRGNQETLLGALGSGAIDAAIVAVGNNIFRRTLGEAMRERGYGLATLIHPSAVMSPSVHVGTGTVVMAGAVVNADTRIGEDVILNTRCSIDHDCEVGVGTHIAPGVTLCGGVKVGMLTLIGVGSSARPNVTVGSRVTIGAGSVIVSNIGNDVVAMGTPAKLK